MNPVITPEMTHTMVHLVATFFSVVVGWMGWALVARA